MLIYFLFFLHFWIRIKVTWRVGYNEYGNGGSGEVEDDVLFSSRAWNGNGIYIVMC